jgi:hypothetical protein
MLLAGSRTGFLPWEKVLLLALYLWPLGTRLLVEGTRLPFAVVASVVLLALVVRRAAARP